MVLLGFGLSFFWVQLLQGQGLLGRSHAHNDYEKPFRKSLYRALDLGFVSVEVDVYPRKNSLRIAHLPLFLAFRPELQRRYFRRLDQAVKQGSKFRLLIDVKRRPEQAYLMLRAMLEPRAEILSRYYPSSDSLVEGLVEIIWTGRQKRSLFDLDSVQYFRWDGKAQDLEENRLSNKALPLISLPYRRYFRWRGRGPMPEKEREILRTLAQAAEAQGRALRFWGMPNRLEVWEVFAQESTTVFHVDRLKRFRRWALKKA